MIDDDDRTRILHGRVDDEGLTRVLPGSSAPAVREDEDPDRTRVLSQVPGVATKPTPVVAPVGQPGESIIFQCPNGHRIVVGRQYAGRQGKCNKCGAAVRIPQASASKGSPPVPTIGPPPEENDETENDDSSDDSSISQSGPSLSALSFGDSVAKSPSAIDGISAIGAIGAEPATESKIHDSVTDWNFGAGPSSEGPEGAEPPPSFEAIDGNPTSQLVARLWHEREHGGIVELHLDGGAVLLPEWYETKWSKGTHGLFASQAPDGSVTLTAVAWESVQKVVVRQLVAVPDDMFT